MSFWLFTAFSVLVMFARPQVQINLLKTQENKNKKVRKFSSEKRIIISSLTVRVANEISTNERTDIVLLMSKRLVPRPIVTPVTRRHHSSLALGLESFNLRAICSEKYRAFSGIIFPNRRRDRYWPIIVAFFVKIFVKKFNHFSAQMIFKSEKKKSTN